MRYVIVLSEEQIKALKNALTLHYSDLSRRIESGHYTPQEQRVIRQELNAGKSAGEKFEEALQ